MKRYLPLSPPEHDNVETSYQANLVYTLSWAWIIGISVLDAFATALMPRYRLHEVAIILAVNIVAFTCLFLNKNKYTRFASVLLPVALWIIVTAVALTSGGIYASASIAYLPIIITSGFLLGGVSGITMAAICVLSTLTFVILDIYGELPEKWIINTTVTTWMCYTVSLLQVTVIQFWAVGRIRSSFKTIARETEERKFAEMRLKESEFNNRMIARNKILGVAWISPEGCIINASPTFCNMMGYPFEELEGRYFGDFTHPDDLPGELELFEKIRRKEIDNYIVEKRFRHKNGDYFWVELNRTAYYDADTNNIAFYITIIQNIQQRKQTETALKESEERYRVLVENAVEAVLVLDVEKGAFVTFSASALQLFKITAEELLKKGRGGLSPKYQPNGRLSTEMVNEKVQEAVAGGKPIFEWTLCDADGKPISAEVRLVRLPAAGQVLIRGSIIDISERKKAEEELNLAYQHLSYLIENTPLAVIEFDKDLNIKRWSHRAEEVFGWTAAEALGKNVYDPDFHIIYIEDIKAVGKINEELMQGQVDSNLSLNRNYTKDDSIIYSEWYNSVLRDKSGNVISILSLVHNVTERKKAEEELRTTNERLRQLSSHLETIREEERTSIAREIHDELGQKLTGLKMDAGWLSKKILQDDQALQERIAGMIALIDETLKTIRKISSTLRPSLLDDLGLQDALEWQSNEFKKRSGINCHFHVKSGDQYFEKKIATGVFRVYQEALTNIARHAGATRVDTTFEIVKDNLVLTIQDNGVGFDVKELENKKTFGLLGMEERAHMFNGDLKIESEKGKGTTITLKVPMAVSIDKI